MEHIKTYQFQTFHLDEGTFIIEGPVSRENLELMTFDDGLSAFRQPNDQFIAIKEISELKEGRIFVIRKHDHIVGYVTYHYPDPLERWSDGNLEYLIELGAIEISLPYRHLHLGSKLIRLSLADDEYEDYIVLTNEYYCNLYLKNYCLDVFFYFILIHKLICYVC